MGLAVLSCGSGKERVVRDDTARAVEELERLAFVPRGRTARNSTLDVGSDRDLLVDRYEVTWKVWKTYPIDGMAPIPDVFLPRFAPGVANADGVAVTLSEWRIDIPVTGMTLAEAREVADARGLRLPTFEEWMWCALGPRSRILPAGRYQRGLANTADLGLLRPSPVGAFESGKTPGTSVYDLAGNVWEWIDAPPDPDARLTLSNTYVWPNDGGKNAPACVVGGSYLTRVSSLFTKDREVAAWGTTPGHRSSDVGFRCVATAADYLKALPKGIEFDRSLRERIEAVGRTWGRDAVKTLESMQTLRHGEPWIAVLLDGARSER